MTPNDILDFFAALISFPLEWVTGIQQDFYLLNCDVRGFADTPIFTVPLFFFIGWMPSIALFVLITNFFDLIAPQFRKKMLNNIQSKFFLKLIVYGYVGFAIFAAFAFLIFWEDFIKDVTGIHSCNQFRV